MNKLQIFIAVALVSLVALELVFPKRKFSKKLKFDSYLTDGLIVVFNDLLIFVFSVGSLYQISENFFSFNLLSNLNLDNAFVLVGIVIFLDFMVYFWHFLNHQVSLLWMFHKTHHTEIYLNTLSGLRFHIGELFLSILFKSLLLIIVLGVPIEIILLSESLVIIFSMFHHTNIQFGKEKLLSNLIIVPYLHQTHHSKSRKDHDSNYGVIFSFWDRVFKTLLDKDNKEIGLGNIKFQNFFEFLFFGFKYRYWKKK